LYYAVVASIQNQLIGKRVQAIWLALGIHQAEFGRRTGIAPQNFSNWLSGSQRPSLDMALKICVATGATLDWIYRGNADCLPLKLEKARSLVL
jgi:transcriptional regulator with XRE-family HTH domain